MIRSKLSSVSGSIKLTDLQNTLYLAYLENQLEFNEKGKKLKQESRLAESLVLL